MATFFGGDVLFFPGCITKFFMKDVMKNYENLLERFGIKFVKLKEIEKCCGMEALESGYRADFMDLVKLNEDVFLHNRISKVITNCPKCCRTFKEHYNISTEHIIETIFNNMEKLKAKQGELTYYDSPETGRKLGFFNEPRMILEAVGYDVVEMRDNRMNTLCCGAGGGLKRNSPRIANKIAKLVLRQVKTDTLVTADPAAYLHLKENSEGVKVFELSEVLV